MIGQASPWITFFFSSNVSSVNPRINTAVGLLIKIGSDFLQYNLCAGCVPGSITQLWSMSTVLQSSFASAWRGLTEAPDRMRIKSVMDRARHVKAIVRRISLPTFDELCDAEDDKLSDKESNHVLHTLLPSPSTASRCYNLGQRGHSLQLPKHSTHQTATSLHACYTETHIRLITWCDWFRLF